MDASALKTGLILRNEAASVHQYLSKGACQCTHREREMQEEGLLRQESHPSTSIVPLHHPITMKFHNPALISKCVCVAEGGKSVCSLLRCERVAHTYSKEV